jgi:manganese oxidase
MSNRRAFFSSVSSLAAAAFGGKSVCAAQTAAASRPVAVTTPDVEDLPFKIDGGVKVFHLIAEPVKQTIIPGRTFDLWGFNGSAPGPTIQATEGDRVRILFDNHLPEPTAIHWHGLELPIEMDGVPGVGQRPIGSGERFVYDFTLHQNGTFFYHSHMAMQEMVGLLGGFIIHPKAAYTPLVDRDYLIALQEYAVLPNSSVPNSMSMEYNWLTLNGKCGPASTPLVVKLGDRIRIRLINMGMDHHPIHLHGFTFWETGREGARQQESAWTRGNTTLVGVAQARDIEFVADRAGDWMLHCHLPHHMMNQMASNVGPITRVGRGMQAGAGMEEGMGMLRDGNATSENKAPSLGRGLGVGSMSDMQMTNGPLSPGKSGQAMANMAGMNMPNLSESANRVPLFPQDAFMEGEMMAMDKDVDKPETFGLPPGWSGYSGGMMTLLRVMQPDRYDEVMKLKSQQAAKGNNIR